MKTISLNPCTAILATLLFACAAPTLRADLEVNTSVTIHSESDFYQPLAADGTWVEVEKYGRVWRPNNVATDWQPYTAGRWAWTDLGWFWESNESFGWAAYHYGRWHHHPTHHWVWVPGHEWAPAWVAWRVGGNHIGWAPLPPSGVAVTGPSFVFVQTTRFTQPIDRSTVLVNDTTIISQTTLVSNMRTESRTVGGTTAQKVYVNIGPGLEVVQRATGQQIQPQSIQEVARRNSSAEFVRNRSGQPNVNAAATNAPPPTAPAGANNQPNTFTTQPTNATAPAGANQPPTSPPATAPAGSPAPPPTNAPGVQPNQQRVLTPEEQRALLPPEERRRVLPTERTNVPVPEVPGVTSPQQVPPPTTPPNQDDNSTPPPRRDLPPRQTAPPAKAPPPTAPPGAPS